MRRLLIVLAFVVGAPVAAAALHRDTHGTRGNDFIQAAFDGLGRVDCGRGFDVVSADLGDSVASNCEIVSRRLSADLSSNPAGQHETAVEPDDFASGRTVVAAYQLGRFAAGAASSVGFAVSRDAGRTWQRGALPGLTVESSPAGVERAASDPTVAYDALHAVWLIATLTLEPGGTRVMVSRSGDGGHWSLPVTAAAGPSLDKEWLTCDNGAASPFDGRCYALYTDDARDATVSQSSDDGGLTWSSPVRATGFLVGTQPIALPDGTLITLAGSYGGDRSLTGSIEGVRSTDGGATFTRFTVSSLVSASTSPMRALSLASLAIDGAGRLYAAWADCRFRSACAANDLVISTSSDGSSWSAPARIPTAPPSSTISAMIPGLGADRDRPGRLGLVYAYFTAGSCASGACALGVAFLQSPDGGATWTKPLRLDPVPMQMDWLAESNGRMVGDYFSTAFARDRIVPVFALAEPPTGGRLREAVFAASIRPVG
jgi:BNR repeat-like domain